MPNRLSSLAKTLFVEIAVFSWVGLLGLLVILQHNGVLTPQAVRFFTGLLVIVGVAVPFVLVAGFLYRRSRSERDTPIEGCCPRCRYDLTGHPDWPGRESARPVTRLQCPECGTMIRAPTTDASAPAKVEGGSGVAG